MITASIIGLFMVIFGIIAHGLIAHLVLIVGAELAKNSILLIVLNTKFGKKAVRTVKWFAYTKLGRTIGRLLFRINCLFDKAHHKVVTVFKSIKERIIK